MKRTFVILPSHFGMQLYFGQFGQIFKNELYLKEGTNSYGYRPTVYNSDPKTGKEAEQLQFANVSKQPTDLDQFYQLLKEGGTLVPVN